MKTALLAAAAALSLGIGSAYAGDGEGPAGTYVYPGSIYGGAVYAGAQAPVRKTQPVVTAQQHQTMHVYGTRSNQGTWLFPPNPNQGGSN
jgi:hypothetical protein